MRRKTGIILTPQSRILLLLYPLLYSIILAQRLPLSDDPLVSERFSAENGLSHINAYCVLQDRRGYIWIGTEQGLNKFDGYQFTVYTSDLSDSTTLSHDYISVITEDSHGDLWIGTNGGGLNRFDPQTEKFRRFRAEEGGIGGNNVWAIFEDMSGILWIGTGGGGLSRFDRETEEFGVYRHQPDDPQSISSDFIWSICEDEAGNLWIGTDGGGLNRMSAQSGDFRHFRRDLSNPRSISSDTVWTVIEDSRKQIWVGTAGHGFCRVNRSDGSFERFRLDKLNPKSTHRGWIRMIYEDPQFPGHLWIAAERTGLCLFDTENSRLGIHGVRIRQHAEVIETNLKSILRDRSGVLWFASRNIGLFKHFDRRRAFDHLWKDLGNPEAPAVRYVRAICETSDGTLWVATDAGGLNKYHPQTNTFTPVRKGRSANSLSSDFVWAICEGEEGELWIGTGGKGLNRFDPKSGNFTVYRKADQPGEGLSSDFIWSIYRFRQHPGTLWMGTRGDGIITFNTRTEEFESIKHDPGKPGLIHSNFIKAMMMDRRGHLWSGALIDAGLSRLNLQSGERMDYLHNPDDPRSLSDNGITALLEGSDGTIWIGTRNGGLNAYDQTTGVFRVYDEQAGLPNKSVWDILEDNNGQLWVSSLNGLARFDPTSGSFKSFTVEDGLQSAEFTWGSAGQGRNGIMYFGGINGVNSFIPDSIRENPHIPQIEITDFRIINKSVPIGSYPGANQESSPLTRHLSFTKEIDLTYRDNVFGFEFAALNYADPRRNQYAYRLEGFDSDWLYTDANRRYVTYTNLDAGEYTFRVRGSNYDGAWNMEGRSITIRIHPPWWRTGWAYTAYLLLFGLALLGLRQYDLNRVHLGNELKMQRFESKKLQEVDRLKSRFFTNISHEFRTPLTLILGLLDKRIKADGDSDERKDMFVVRRNANRLLDLINQLLELSKLEAGSASLHADKEDLLRFVRRVVLSFASLADQKNISLTLNGLPPEETMGQAAIFVYFDSEKLETVLYNLLSNAFKFTPEGGRVSISLAVGSGEDLPGHRHIPGKMHSLSGCVQIIVSDSGVGIPSSQLPYIFDRFFQAEDGSTRRFEGSGVGLALAKELIELHRGQIEVSSIDGAGTSFTLSLPLGRTHLNAEEIVETREEDAAEQRIDPRELLAPAERFAEGPIPDEADSESREEEIVILIVEDHRDLRHHIRSLLSHTYHVEEAENGRRGLEKAVEIIPDLVISDIMMPEMNGYALCTALKQDEKTNHVPVILLTAKAMSSDKIEGLESGADDYLIKPFDPDELHARVRNLIRSRRQLRQKYSAELLLGPGQITVPSVHKVFLERINAVIAEHLDNENFSVEQLGREIGMSRGQLHRKLKALTNQSPSEFIRTFRLQRAADLIRQNAGNITEIAYQVGFNSQAYFSRSFQELFGKSPSEYKKSIH